jgi:acyl-CoA thioesterase
MGSTATHGTLDGNRDAMHEVLLGDAFARHLGAAVTGWGGGWARATLTVAEQHTNLAGIVHGGVTFSLGDVVFGVSSNSWGRLAVALAVDVQFLAAAEPGDVLVATSTERHRTRRTGAYLIEVHASAQEGSSRPSPDNGPDDDDAPGRLVGSLHAMVHRTDRWHLGEDAWSEAWRAAH